MIHRFVICLSLFCLWSLAGLSQTPESKDAEKAKERTLVGLRLFEEGLTDGRGLKIHENRAQLLAQAADTIWPRDEKRARELISETIEALRLAMLELTDEQSQPSDAITKVRDQVVNAFAERDPQMTLDFLRATRLPGKESSTQAEEQRERQLVKRIAANDPAKLLKIAADEIAEGNWANLPDTIWRADSLDHEATAKFVAQAVERLRTENLTTNMDALKFAANTLRSEIGRRSAVDSATENKEELKVFLDENGLRDLAQIFANGLIRFGDKKTWPNEQIVREAFETTANIMPGLNKYAPALASQLKKQIDEFAKTSDPDTKQRLQWAATVNLNAAVDEIIEAAKKVPEDKRGSYYFRITEILVVYRDEIERARQLITENFPTPALREKEMHLLNWLAAQVNASKGRFEEVMKDIALLPNDEERAQTLSIISRDMIKQNKPAIARELLERGQRYINPNIRTAQQMGAQLSLIQVWLEIDPARGFDLIAPIFKRFDEASMAMSVASRFDYVYSQFVYKGEMRLARMPISISLRSYLDPLPMLASNDADRTRTLLNSMRNPALRALSRLTAARGALGVEENRK